MTDRAAGAADTGRVSWRELAAIAVLLLGLGVSFTWPLARHFSTDVLYTHEAAPGYERVPIAQGDHLQVLYLDWLLGDSLRERRSLLEDPYQFRDGSPPGFFFQPSLLPLLTLLLAPLGLVGAHNALTLLSFAAAGVAAYLLLRQFVCDRWAAVAGALVVALFPYRVTQLAGHVNGLLAFLVPLYLYFLERLLRARRWPGWAAAAGVTFFFAGAMEFHIVYYLTLFLGAYLPWRLLAPLSAWLADAAPVPAARRPGLVPPLLSALGGAGAGVALYHAADRVHHFAQPRGWAVSAVVTAGLALLLWRALSRAAERYLPPPAGGWAPTLARPFAAGLLLALAPLGSRLALPHFGRLLAAAAVLLAAGLARPVLRAARGARPLPGWRGRAGDRLRRHLVNLAYIACTLAFLVVVRGRVFAPSVAGGGRRLAEVSAYSPRPSDLFAAGAGSAERLVYPGLVAAGLALAGLFALRRVEDRGRRAALGFLAGAGVVGYVLAVGPNLEEFPLYHLLFRSVPMFNFPRVAGRILVVGVVGFAALAALGVAALRSRAGRGAGLVTFLALGLIVADYHPRHAPGLTMLPSSHPVYDRLARERSPGEVILELPLWPGDTAWTSIYLWYTTRYRQRLLNGYSPAAPRNYVERVFWPLYPLDFGELGRPQVDLLRRLGIRYLVFHEEAYPPKISEFPFSTALENLRRSPYLEQLAAEAPLSLFRLRDPAPAAEPAIPRATSPVGSLWEAERWVREPGRRVADPSASGAAVAAFPPGTPGRLPCAPPRRVLPSGTYRARARFLAEEGSQLPALALLVADPEAGTPLGDARIGAGAGGAVLDLEATFTLDKPTPVAFEVESGGTAPVRWDYLLVTFAAEPEPRLDVEIEALWHIGRVIADARASGGTAVELLPGYHPRDFAFAGPDRELPAGAWTATLRFAGGAAAAPVAGERFDVAVANTAEPLVSVGLPAPSAAGYQEVALPFELARSAPIRFRVFFPGVRRLVLDRITIARR